MISLNNNTITVNGDTFLESIDPAFNLVDSTFLQAAPATQISLGSFVNVKHHISLHRNSPGWMEPKTGQEERDILPETQFLLIENAHNIHILLIPLIGDNFRGCLSSQGQEELFLMNKSGDEEIESKLIYINAGTDPYELIEKASLELCQYYGIKSRKEKKVPDLINYFG